jgi:hypothetical protein
LCPQKVVATKTITATASCSVPPKAKSRIPDPINHIQITILPNIAKRTADADALPQPTGGRAASLEYKRAVMEGRALSDETKARFVRERREALALNKRAPDRKLE